METTKYNGWTNYETWLVNIWFDQSLSEWAGEFEITSNDELETKSALKTHLEDCFESYFEDCEKLPESGFLADIINASLREIDWYDIAEHYLEDCIQLEEEAQPWTAPT